MFPTLKMKNTPDPTATPQHPFRIFKSFAGCQIQRDKGAQFPQAFMSFAASSQPGTVCATDLWDVRMCPQCPARGARRVLQLAKLQEICLSQVFPSGCAVLVEGAGVAGPSSLGLVWYLWCCHGYGQGHGQQRGAACWQGSC